MMNLKSPIIRMIIIFNVTYINIKNFLKLSQPTLFTKVCFRLWSHGHCCYYFFQPFWLQLWRPSWVKVLIVSMIISNINNWFTKLCGCLNLPKKHLKLSMMMAFIVDTKTFERSCNSNDHSLIDWNNNFMNLSHCFITTLI